MDVAFRLVAIRDMHEVHQLEWSIDRRGTAQPLDPHDRRDLRLANLEDGIGKARVPRDVDPPQPLVLPTAFVKRIEPDDTLHDGGASHSRTPRFGRSARRQRRNRTGAGLRKRPPPPA